MKRPFLRVGVWILIASAFGCGGGGGGGGGGTGLDTNSSGFPIVEGTYSFTVPSFAATCSDGSSGTFPGFSVNLNITQDVNEITAVGNVADVPGLNIIDKNVTAGTVVKNATFTMSSVASVEFPGAGLTAQITYFLSGLFTTDGWHGDYRYDANFTNIILSCTYLSKFSGEKISPSPKPFYVPKDDAPSDDNYDLYTILGQSGALL